MKLLHQHGIGSIFHYAPLHYLPFIARSKSLKSKPALLEDGYLHEHFRSTSAHLDQARGFGHYVHLSTVAEPPILAAKLQSGFPHVGIEVQTAAYSSVDYDLCRFNIAKTRQLRREDKQGFPESARNGKYYDGFQIPIARTEAEKLNLLKHLDRSMMAEVLITPMLILHDAVLVKTFCVDDRDVAKDVLQQVGVPWEVTLQAPSSAYEKNPNYAAQVRSFIDAALADSDWRGNGLEYDRV